MRTFQPLAVATSRVWRGWMYALALVTVTLSGAPALTAQAHDHANESAARDPRLDLVLGGPHLLLYHRGYLALGEKQITGLQRLQRSVCEAERTYIEQTASWRGTLTALLDDTAAPPPRLSEDAANTTRLRTAMSTLAAAESVWLTELMQARRDALALLTATQRVQVASLREHWARESVAMIEEATRPGQRGHPGTQLPIRVPGMVVSETTLLPHCEALHGASRHIVVPPPR